MDRQTRGETGILTRYATVLDTLAAAPGGLSLIEVVRATGLPRGTAHRLLGALRGVGFITGRDGRKVYVLGPRLLRLLHLGQAPAAVEAAVRPLLDGLAARFKETAFLAKLVGQEVRSVAMRVPDSESQSYVQPGRVMPVHAAASAKAIWAYQGAGPVARLVAEPRARFTDKTRTGEAELRADLERVRRNGYAVCDGELDPGVLSYACPVHLDGAGVLYAIGMVGLSQRLGRFAPEEVVAALRDAAEAFARGPLAGAEGESS
jgi:DNA-binding IclR family transcriptional regulator